jgi:hypothetical protein
VTISGRLAAKADLLQQIEQLPMLQRVEKTAHIKVSEREPERLVADLFVRRALNPVTQSVQKASLALGTSTLETLPHMWDRCKDPLVNLYSLDQGLVISALCARDSAISFSPWTMTESI